MSELTATGVTTVTTPDVDLSALFAPRGVAVVGASRTGTKLGSVMAQALRAFGGPLALVNSRNPDPAAGLYPSVGAAADALGEPLDLAVLCVPAAACAGALEDAASAGVRAALVCAGGFAEAGGDGVAYQERLVAAARESGVRLLGPNTSGFLVPHRRLTASFVPGAGEVPAGAVAVVAASGGVNHALAFLLADAGVGISLAVGLGNGTDVDAADVLEHLASDTSTAAVALHVESVGDGPRLYEAVRRLTRTKPVVALVVGRNDVAEFAASHTGALATSWRTTRAVLRQAGAVLVDDERDLVDAVATLSRSRLRPAADPGVGIVTAQAGPGLILLDALRGAAVSTPTLTEATQARIAGLLPPMTFQRNPVDTGRPGETFGEVLTAVATDPGVDVVAVYALAELGSTEQVAAAATQDVPVVAGLGGRPAEVRELRHQLHSTGVPAHLSPSALATGVAALVQDARLAHRAQHADEAPRGGVAGLAGRSWDEHQAKSVLEALGLRTTPRRACEDEESAHEALDALGGPVAVKLLDAAVLHKTEIGGVHLGVRTHAELDDALAGLRAAGASRFLVEAMAPPGVDLIVGAHRDAVFGPVVLLGLGGTQAEALADVTMRLASLSTAEAAAMPDELLGAALLDGWRSGPRLDRAELAQVLRALGAQLLADPGLESIEINPLRLTVDGLVALDAVITTAED
ncbi:acetate--CoA ligase family protein [Georgenia yuyongxinii]|uniref:CoA-binding protein n=1 Tax=Georgenia yuyongxinii TaxID=2589797 RepID=A0A552WSJ9_9MICO|nr:acetate--CoA ligase family protein [Georgenia yuyongxinii]TRW45818.1 CoA-binding protein [Georgenia yuyongxinii]